MPDDVPARRRNGRTTEAGMVKLNRIYTRGGDKGDTSLVTAAVCPNTIGW